MARQVFAVIPAAGHSRRMGQPKLLLSLGGITIIERVVRALSDAGVTASVVVTREEDQALAQVVRQTTAHLVQPNPAPSQMRESVWAALQWIEAQFHPADDDGWLLIPADHPTVDAVIVRHVIAAWSATPERVTLPTFDGRRGHPTIFPWGLMSDVGQLSADQGLNQLVRRLGEGVQELPVNAESVLWDLDTPEDYQRIVQQQE